MFYICKFSESWTLYDGIQKASRPLIKAEIDCLKILFSSVIDDNRMLLALKVNIIQPNKLMKLPLGNKKSVNWKSQDKSISHLISAGNGIAVFTGKAHHLFLTVR